MQQHVVVIGAGIVGICCGLKLQEKGFEVTLIDPEPPACMTSYGNAGAIAITEVMPIADPGVLWRVPRWLLDPMGPLAIRFGHLPSLLSWLWRFNKVSNLQEIEHGSKALASILKSSLEESKIYIRESGVEHLLIEKGAITIYQSHAGFERDALTWKTKRARGIVCEEVNLKQLLELEPALAQTKNQPFNLGVFMPQWSHLLNPYAMSVAFAKLFARRGGRITQNQVIDFWFKNNKPAGVICADGGQLAFDQIVIAAGVWSKEWVERLGDRVLLAAERGYNTTLRDPGIQFTREIIFGERKFVMTPMNMGLRIGGAAEFAAPDSPPNFKRSKALLKLAKSYFPALNTADGSEWMGNRPSTPDSLPVIGRSPTHANILYAFGHGHLGLTLGATTGKLISQLATNEVTDVDIKPFSIARFM